MNRRRWIAAPLMAAALALATTGCGGDDDGKSVETNGSASGSTTNDTSPSSYVGLRKKAAIAKADAADVTWRILREDDEHFPATMDYDAARINFEIDDGEVTKATLG